MRRWVLTVTQLPADGQRVDWLTAAGDEVTGGRYRVPNVWLMPADGQPTGERVIAWAGPPDALPIACPAACAGPRR